MKNVKSEGVFSPHNLETYTLSFNEPIYSNKKIENEFLNIIQNSKLLKDISKGVNTLLDKKLLVCGYSKKALSYYKSKIYRILLSHLGVRHPAQLAYFDPISKNVIILLDNTTTISGRKLLLSIDGTIAHELTHFVADRDPKSFMRHTLKSHLIPWYKYIFNRYIQEYLDIDKEFSDDDVGDTIKRLFFGIEIYNSHTDVKAITNNIYLPLFSKVIDDNNVAYRISSMFPKVFFNLAYNEPTRDIGAKKHIEAIQGLGYDAYEDVFKISKKKINTFLCQEFYFVSEVMSVLSGELGMTKSIQNMINHIR